VLYDTKGAAESARDDLVALGVPSGDVTIRGAEGGGPSATSTSAATEDKGFWGGLADLFAPDEDRHAYAEGVRRGGYLLTARVPDGLEDQAVDALERHDPVDLDQRAESWRQEGWTGYQAGAASAGAGAGATAGAVPSGTAYLAETGAAEAGAGYTGREERRSDLGAEGLGTATAATNAEGEEVLQVAEERLRVGKREVERGGVRVRSYVVETPVEESVLLRDETINVERRRVDRPASDITADAFRERTIELTETDEEAVVAKTARVTEEVVISKDVTERTERVSDTVRRTEVEVENTGSTERAANRDVKVDRDLTKDPKRDI
jgi:uncharacterized protein (TIGR02271 family)